MKRLLLLSLAALFLARVGFGRDITTLSGYAFRDAVVTQVERTGIEIRFQGGTTFLSFADLPGDQVAGFFQIGNGEGALPPDAVPPAEAAQGPDADAAAAPDALAPGPELQFVPEIVALDGSVFDDVFITSIGRRGFRFHHRNGSGFLDFSMLSEQLRQRFAAAEATLARAREQHGQASTSTHRPSALTVATRPIQVSQPRATMGSAAPAAPAVSQQSPSFPMLGFGAGNFAPRPSIMAPVQGGVISGGSFSGRGSAHMGGAAGHFSGGHR